MRNRKISTLLDKKFDKLKGKELLNVLDKIDEVSSNDNLFHYKNLKNPMQKYRRVHVNSSFVLLFFLFENCIYFVDYKHHDEAYLKSKKEVKKYDNLNFRDFN